MCSDISDNSKSGHTLSTLRTQQIPNAHSPPLTPLSPYPIPYSSDPTQSSNESRPRFGTSPIGIQHQQTRCRCLVFDVDVHQFAALRMGLRAEVR